MAEEYFKVLKGLKCTITVIGRGQQSAKIFEQKTGIIPHCGGIDEWIKASPRLPDAVIIAVSVDQLASSTITLLKYGVRKILVEKPGGLDRNEIKNVCDFAKQQNAVVLVAYNRRFFASTRKALEIIAEEGGISSFHFEFTEWAHVIEELDLPTPVLESWFIANSSHVADHAFFLGGKPESLHSISQGRLPWHSKSSKFAGCGLTTKGATFSYCANWEAPGRWSLEILTKNRRLIFKPFEILQAQEKGSLTITTIEIDNKLDIDFKPGVFLQTKSFLENDYRFFCDIQEQLIMVENVYNKISGYTK